MAIYDQTRQGELYRLINRDNPDLPVPLSPENSEILGTISLSEGSFNTATQVVGLRYHGYKGRRVIKYNRIDLSTYCKNIDVKINATPETTKDLDSMVPFLNAALGIYLEVGDYPNEPLKVNPDTLYFEGTIKLKSNHPIYIGNLAFKVSGYTVDLDSLVTVRDINVLTDPAPHVGGKFNASMLTYGHDYTEHGAFWANWPIATLDDVNAKHLASKLNSIDGLPWVWSAKAAPFNLKQVAVLYIGPPIPKWAGSANNPEPNRTYDRVMVIQPSSTYCPNIAAGNGWGLIIHYDLIEG